MGLSATGSVNREVEAKEYGARPVSLHLDPYVSLGLFLYLYAVNALWESDAEQNFRYQETNESVPKSNLLSISTTKNIHTPRNLICPSFLHMRLAYSRTRQLRLQLRLCSRSPFLYLLHDRCFQTLRFRSTSPASLDSTILSN